MNEDDSPFKSLPYIEPTDREIRLALACRKGYYHAIDGWAHMDEWLGLSPAEQYAWVEAARHVIKNLVKDDFLDE